MTHVPDCEKTPRRASKMIALCGAAVSIRKAVSVFPMCPRCEVLDLGRMGTLNEIFRTINRAVDLLLERSAFIKARKVMARKRWRR